MGGKQPKATKDDLPENIILSEEIMDINEINISAIHIQKPDQTDLNLL